MRLSPGDRRRQERLETASARLDAAEAACGMLVVRLRQLWRHNPHIGPEELEGLEQELACIVDGVLDGHEQVRLALSEDREKRRGKSK